MTTTTQPAPTSAPATERADGDEPLVGNAPRQSWPVTLETLRANISHASDEAVELMVWCFLRCCEGEKEITLQEFAAKVGYDYSTLHKILRGKYVKPVEKGAPPSTERMPFPAELVKNMRLFRELELERAMAGRTDFVKTPTAKRIFNACDLARESQSPVFLIGPSHIGKTWALCFYKEDNNHGRTVYVRLKAASGLGGMVKAIAKAIGGIGMKANTATLIESIKTNLKPNMLLILDEVHELMYTYRKESFFACLEVLREIYDAAQCGMVFCGTQLLFRNIDDNRGELEQLLRRGVHKVVLPTMPTVADLTAILQVHGLDFPDKGRAVEVKYGGRNVTEQPYEILRQVGKDQGLKAICERIRYGQKLAKKGNDRFRWEYFVRAHLIITGESTPTPDWN